jgi:hypothetical protein
MLGSGVSAILVILELFQKPEEALDDEELDEGA